MLNYISTRNKKIKITASQAILNGLAEDGGLYVPTDLSAIKLNYKELLECDYYEMASEIFNIYFPDFGKEKIQEIINKSYKDKFDSKKVTPLEKVEDAYVLELFWGPTCAFKDVALSVLPNLMTEAAKINSFSNEILILTATSGDTGSAALDGFANVPGTHIIVFYPEGGVSMTQKLQMVTQEAENTCVCAVKGNFDDAQNGVKKLFSKIKKPCEGIDLSSANSINIGRLVPQTVYYFSAYKQLVDAGDIVPDEKVDFIVPTGNFGDIMAGYLAKKMGLPVGRLVCASNRNNVLTEFLTTGHYNRKRKFYKTDSPSMDILISSNLERLLYFVCGAEKTADYMKQLTERGEYTITKEELAEINEDFSAAYCDDDRTRRAIKSVFDEDGYLMDTHTAVAWSIYEDNLRSEKKQTKSVILSTASAYKFTKSVLKAFDKKYEEDDRKNMITLAKFTDIMAPKSLSGVFDKPVVHSDVISIEEMEDYVVGKAESYEKN